MDDERAKLRRVGHKGADLIALGTPESFDAALAAGVDMIEFDVLPSRHPAARPRPRRTIRSCSRTTTRCARRSPHTLDEGLEHLSSDAFAGIEIDVDLKLPGYQLRVLDALRSRGMLDRALISSQFRSSLRLLRATEPRVRLGWSVPKLKRDPFRTRATTLGALLAAQAIRVVFPDRAARAIRAGPCDAVMAHWRLVTPRLVRLYAAPAASSTCGRSMSCRGCARSMRWASPG